MTEERCERVQEILIARGPTAFQQDAESRTHLVTCDDCFAFLEAMSELDGRMAAMPTINPPDDLVAKTLAGVGADVDPSPVEAAEAPAAEPKAVRAAAAPTSELPPADEPAPKESWIIRDLKILSRIATWPVRSAWGMVWVVRGIGWLAVRAWALLNRGLDGFGAVLKKLWSKRFGKSLVLLGGMGTATACLFVLAVGITLTTRGGAPLSQSIAHDGYADFEASEDSIPKAPPMAGRYRGDGVVDTLKKRLKSSDKRDESAAGEGIGGLLGGNAGPGAYGKGRGGGGQSPDTGILEGLAKRTAPKPSPAPVLVAPAEPSPDPEPEPEPEPEADYFAMPAAQPAAPPPPPPEKAAERSRRRDEGKAKNIANLGLLAQLGSTKSDPSSGAVADIFDEPEELFAEEPMDEFNDADGSEMMETEEEEQTGVKDTKKKKKPKTKRPPPRRVSKESGFFDFTGEDVDDDEDQDQDGDDALRASALAEGEHGLELGNDRGPVIAGKKGYKSGTVELDIDGRFGKDEIAIVEKKVELERTKREQEKRQETGRLGRDTGARFTSSLQDGQTVGLRLTGIRPGSFWSQLAVQNGDVIRRVNGQPFNSAQQALALHRHSGRVSRLTLDLVRRGQPVTLTCERAGRAFSCAASLGETQFADPRVSTFLGRYSDLAEVRFKAATGYWANTYVPGDANLRVLQKRLLAYDRGLLSAYASRSLHLEDRARQHSQPFDAPTSSALAVYLHATERGLTEKKRMVVQVGMQATPRHSGRRPAMNVGIVLDLRGAANPKVASNVRALLEAFTKARDISDRFALVVAGKPGGVIVAPEIFRHGPVTVATQKLFEGRFADDGDPTLSLGQALERAYATVGSSDNPTSPLGSSVVVLVTGQSLGAQLGSIERAVHRHAVDGIPTSVISLGAPAGETDRLVLAGQGNRRLLSNPNDALGLVQRELSAVSGVVARAVRLRIRLAPGVKLVDVLGSYRLDEVRAEQVRQAEKSIDLRMSRNLGIEADRGEDEEGIQIVIPSFYAGDGHVFLLDVVAEGPGPIADVTVRYKDLVFLKNGVARSNLTLQRRAFAQGPLERNVLKNLLGYELSETLERAGDELANGDTAGALATITEFRALITSMRRAMPGLYQDRDLIADGQMLDEYALLLGSNAMTDAGRRAHLTDSLRFAGLLKILPRPETD